MDWESRLKELRVVSVQDMLQQIGLGLGSAHQTLWQTSRTPIGTLAVKDVDVKVEFNMSSNASLNGVDAPGLPAILGAKSFFLGVASEDSRQSNVATITLRVVNVMPDQEDAERLRLLLLGVGTALNAQKLPYAQQSEIASMIAEAEGLIQTGKLTEARTALDRIIAAYEKLIEPVKLDGPAVPTKKSKH